MPVTEDQGKMIIERIEASESRYAKEIKGLIGEKTLLYRAASVTDQEYADWAKDHGDEEEYIKLYFRKLKESGIGKKCSWLIFESRPYEIVIERKE